MQKYNMLEGNDGILSQSKSILKEYDLCDFCLGRFFINLSSFSSARRLGLKIRNSINSKNISECYICRNLFSSLDYYV
jgi:tRNA pseudouridine synthase 10